MARRYSRDNRGRFASGGTGATARGGRLKTASGNKRATQTTKAAAAAKPGGSIAGKVKRNPAAAGKIGQAKAATAAKLGGRLNPAKKAFRAADKKFLNTIQKEKGISKAASDARRDAKSSSDFTKTPTAKGAKLNNTISQTKEKRNIASKQKLLKERLTRAYNLSGNGADAKGRRTAKVKAKAIATLQGTKRPDISDGTVGGLRKPRTSTGYKAPSSRLPMPSRSARAQGRARALAQTQRFDAVGRRLGNPTKMDNKARTGARAVDFNSNPKAFLRRTLVQKVQSRGGKGTAGFVARPRSLTQTPKRIKPSAAPKAAKPTSAKGARLGGTRRTTQAAAPQNTTANRTGQSKTLNRFNSRPVGTMVAGKRDNLVPSTKPVPLDIQRKESDRAFARIATKAARQRAAAPAKAAVRRTEANRTARALANQKRTVQTVLAKGGKRFSPTRKQKKSLVIADAASRFYSAKRVNSLPNFRVNTSKPGFRLPRNMR